MSWEEKTIDQLGTIVTGKTPSTKNRAFYDGEYMFVTPTDLDWQSYYVRDTHSTVTELARDKHKNQFIPADTTVFTCIGNTIGKCGISSEDCLSNQQINSVVPNHDHDPKFIYYLLNHNRSKIRSIGLSGGAAQPIINKSTFSSVKVSVPDSKVAQERIASVLSAYDDLIENNKRRIELLEESARQLYKEWFVRFRFPGHEHVKIIDDVPEDWCVGTVSDFYQTSSGGTPSRKIPEYYTGEINWVKTQELQNSFIFETDEKITEEAVSKSSAKVFPQGTVLVAMYGATIGQVGILSKLSCSNQACCALIPKTECTNYIHAFLFLLENKSGLVNLGQGAAQNNISQSVIKVYPMVIPRPSLMMQFTENLAPVFDQIKNLSMQNLQLAKARDLLLPKLMSGEIAA